MRNILKQIMEFSGYVLADVAAFGVDWRLGTFVAGLVVWSYGVAR